MDRRTLSALLLSALVIVLTPMLFRALGFGRSVPVPAVAADTGKVTAPSVTSTPQAASSTTPAPVAAGTSAPTASRASAGDTVSAAFGKTRYVFGTMGASPQA